MQKHRKCIW